MVIYFKIIQELSVKDFDKFDMVNYGDLYSKLWYLYEVCPESSWTTCPQPNLSNNKFLHLYHHIQECIRNTCVKNDKDTTSDMYFTTGLL